MIVSLNDVKTILKISDTSQDDLINFYIPIIQADIIDKTNNKFIDNKIVFQSSGLVFAKSTNTITDSGFNFYAGLDINISGSQNNDSNVEIESLTDTVLTILNLIKLIDEDSGNLIILSSVKYPEALKITASKMIGYRIEPDKSNVKSEKIGRHSITYEDSKSSSDYPDDIISGLKPYILREYI